MRTSVTGRRLNGADQDAVVVVRLWHLFAPRTVKEALLSGSSRPVSSRCGTSHACSSRAAPSRPGDLPLRPSAATSWVKAARSNGTHFAPPKLSSTAVTTCRACGWERPSVRHRQGGVD